MQRHMGFSLFTTIFIAFLNGCASTETGKLVRMPAESAERGDIFGTLLSVVAVPVLLPFMAVGDIIAATGAKPEDVKSAADVTSEYLKQKYSSPESSGPSSTITPKSAAAPPKNADCLTAITRIHEEAGTRISSARTPTESAHIQLVVQAIPQKQLFEGRCSSHPQAAAYVASANRLIAETERTLGTSATAAADHDRSKIIAADGRSAKDCVELKTLSRGDSSIGSGGRVLANNCGETVEIYWCYVDTECSREFGNQWSIGAGRSWPVSATRDIRWNACYGANTISAVKGTAGTRHYCKSPVR